MATVVEEVPEAVVGLVLTVTTPLDTAVVGTGAPEVAVVMVAKVPAAPKVEEAR